MFRRTLLNYRESAKNTEQVAASITRFFVKLAEVYDKDLSKWAYLHFMGHSLGAHVVGQAAEMLKPFVNNHRVTGFDPAKPYFDEGEGVRMRLDKSNAQFVDVIHTNSSPDEKTFGLYEPLGHIDFYPNGGNTQPCCTRNSKTIHDDEINKCVSYLVWGIDATGLFANFVSKIINKQYMVCDHGQGQDYYIQSMDGSSKEVHFVPNGVDFDPRRRTTVIVQGFLGHLHRDEMKKIGNKLLEWLKNIWTEQGVSLGSWGPIHFIGYSLGAHVVGQAAERLRVEENLLIDRITALDPSEPCFEDANNPLRLSKNNAKFVDVIHTDGARYTNEAFGLLEPIGHADFYVNGGVANQPGCERKKRSGLHFTVLGNGLCSHARSVEVFIDSIVNANSTSCKFWGHSWQLGTSEADTKEILKNSCDTTICPQVGINAESFDYDNGKTNTYYVKTPENAPFCEPA
ncbi:hypothetical protein TSAR_004361 [Trichomalopsis sarcophagae]|uniref:phospholipase A1 n=1 Tax=Trichomalopsis sarcophagae TaxID=543379 RepID=A0A232F2S8_9HYME|nr:hypothetical protein TSAR_004361 [Trichomalopsis sarcophagae]